MTAYIHKTTKVSLNSVKGHECWHRFLKIKAVKSGKMKKLFLTICLLNAIQLLNAQTIENPDKDFAIEAALGGMKEVELGKLAQQKAQSEKVKELGRMMETEHTQAGEELKALASAKGISLPTTMDRKGQDKHQQLSKKEGTAFDLAYSKYMVKDHKEDIKKFKKEAEKGDDPDLKNWAAKILPTLEHHLQMSNEAVTACKGKK
jgi:putative membrane protein